MTKVLIVTGRYLPGYKDGGPVRSIINLTEWFGNEINISIVCADRDHGDTESYPGILVDDWNKVGNANVFYVPPHGYTMGLLADLAGESDVVYCCGPYSDYARKLMWLKKHKKFSCPLVVASMGSFSPEAYAIHGAKKKLFVKAYKLLGMFKKITWSVTSQREDDELKAVIGENAKTVIAEDLPRKGTVIHRYGKADDCLKIVFLSRISRKKNLDCAARVLSALKTDRIIIFDIYGTMEDKEYYDLCRKQLMSLPDNITWRYCGEVPTERVPEVFAAYDVFFFPTRGENYGHVIAEAMASGCIPVISDTTPWMDLTQKQCGFVVGLSEENHFAEVLEYLAQFNEDEFAVLRENAYRYITEHNTQSVANSGYRELFGLG